MLQHHMQENMQCSNLNKMKIQKLATYFTKRGLINTIALSVFKLK